MTERRAARGSAVVEFALVVPVLMLVLLAVVEVALVARTQLELVHAAREGVRTAATVPDPSRAVDAVRGAMDPALAERARVTVERPDRVGGIARVTVTVVQRIGPAGLDWLPVELRARAAMRVER